MDMDTRVANAGTWGIRGLNGNGKNTIETIKKNVMFVFLKKLEIDKYHIMSLTYGI